MPATRQRPRRRATAPGEKVWVIDLAAAEAQRAMRPATVATKRRWDRWLGAAAGAVWAYDVIAALLQVRH